mmetsp:Transcript_36766/g.103735  ORF Transcript_36766/g.103735 Transcript_36766/m.103735 type:complete len:689 (-) Transcript_36766:224-2290(-)|eukprot:CAMPEP_0117650146 /NCGR_PEP_ID=MMETSP0804-20121206/1381_1 /TAXON_ID=1074897 /ORGANISM="Tetraselmis astigmatica, Strain CCMP880" /LENGTH=688 /DNA_ID=CAMNT_0005455993 /DNA_START=224 /DNA_END=2290 /DNA_ORIENTATION=-
MAAGQDCFGSKLQAGEGTATCLMAGARQPQHRGGAPCHRLRLAASAWAQPGRLQPRLPGVPCRAAVFNARGSDEEVPHAMPHQPRVPARRSQRPRQLPEAAVNKLPTQGAATPRGAAPALRPAPERPIESGTPSSRTHQEAPARPSARELFRSPAVVGLGLCLAGQAAVQGISAAVKFFGSGKQEKEVEGGSGGQVAKPPLCASCQPDSAAAFTAGLLPAVMCWDMLESMVEGSPATVQEGEARSPCHNSTDAVQAPPHPADLTHLAEELNQLNATLDNTTELLRNLTGNSSEEGGGEEPGWRTADHTSKTVWFSSMEELKGSLREVELTLDSATPTACEGATALPAHWEHLEPLDGGALSECLLGGGHLMGDAVAFASMDDLKKSLSEELPPEELVKESPSPSAAAAGGPIHARGASAAAAATTSGACKPAAVSARPPLAFSSGLSLSRRPRRGTWCMARAAASSLGCDYMDPAVSIGTRFGSRKTQSAGTPAGQDGGLPSKWLSVGLGSAVAAAVVSLLQASRASQRMAEYVSKRPWLLHRSLEEFWQSPTGSPSASVGPEPMSRGSPAPLAASCLGSVAMAHYTARGTATLSVVASGVVAAATTTTAAGWSWGPFPHLLVTVRVQDDTSLWALAHKHYGSAVMWKVLRDANPHVPTKPVKAGTLLRLYLPTGACSAPELLGIDSV